MPVHVVGNSGAQIGTCTPVECPQREGTVKEQQNEELGGTDPICRSYGDALTVHLDCPLPLLQVEPWSDQKSDADRNGITPVRQVIGGEFRNADHARTDRNHRHEQPPDCHRENQTHDPVTVTDAGDIEFLPQQHRRGEHDKQGQRKIKRPRLKAERLPKVSDKRKDGQRDRQELIEEKDETKRARPCLEKARRGIPIPPRDERCGG